MKKIKNPIIQISSQGPGGASTYDPVEIDFIEKKIELNLDGNKFKISIGLNHKDWEVVVNAYVPTKREYSLAADRPIQIKCEERTYVFQLAKDFIVKDNIRFTKFIKHSTFLHLFILAMGALYTFFAPEIRHQLRISIDQKRINELVAKINKKKMEEIIKPLVVATPVPEVKEAPKVVVEEKKPPGPPPKEEKKKTKKLAPNSMLAETKKPPPPTKEDPKRLVVKKGPEKIGGVRKADTFTRESGVRMGDAGKMGAAKANAAAATKARLSSSLGFLSSTAPSKFNVQAGGAVPSSSKNYAKGVSASGGGSGQKDYLSKLVTTASGPGSAGPIRTRGAREIATGEAISEGAVFGNSRGKSLNNVQGQVAVGRLQDYGAEGGAFGDSFGGGGGGMRTSGKGNLSDSEIEKALKKHLSKLQYCYEKALLYDSTLSGVITMGWNINVGGSVSGVKVVKTQLKNQKLYDCISQEIGKISFPSPKGGAVNVQYPFNFTPSSI